MGRPPSDEPREHQIRFRVTTAEKKLIDEKRGKLSVSEYLRRKALGKR